MADIIQPEVTVISVERTKISAQTDRDSSDITWQCSEEIDEYTVRVGGVDQTTGTEIDSSTTNVAADTDIVTTVYDEDLSLGSNQVNLYAKDLAGNWVSYMQVVETGNLITGGGDALVTGSGDNLTFRMIT
jgi:hypothetical protein